MATIYREGDLGLLPGKVAVIGYGSQGHAHALNLRDSGVTVEVGLREGSPSRAAAEEAGLTVRSIPDAVAGAQLVAILLPDQVQPKVWAEEIEPNLAPDAAVLFAHGFNVHFGRIDAAPGHDVIMVAPKGPGHIVRRLYTEGYGTPALFAVAQDASGRARELSRGVRGGPRRHARGRAGDDVRRGDRDRPLRRAGRALRRRHRADPARFRDPRRGRLPARDRVLRVPARAEADRRPDLRGRALGHAPLDLGHGRVRRPLARASA